MKIPDPFRLMRHVRFTKITILIGAIFVVLVVSAGTIYAIHKHNQKVIQTFGDQRGQVLRKYVYSIVGFSPTSLGDLSKTRCTNYDEFISLIQKDTRQMSIADLEHALKLYDECHYDVTADQYTLDSDFSSEVSKLIGMSSEVKDSDIIKTTSDIASTWRKIQLLKSEKTDIANQEIGFAQGFWQEELNYKENRDSFSQRQDKFKELNGKISKDDDRAQAIDSQMKEQATSETDLWNIFISKTGYKVK